MKAVTTNALRKKMNTYFDEVVNSPEVLLVPRNNEDDEAVVILSIKEYNSLTETGHLLSTVANRKRLNESIEQLENGKTVAYSIEDEEAEIEQE